MKKSCRFIQVLGAIALIGLFLAGNADAYTRIYYSGTECQPNYGSQVGDFSYYSTGITNTSTATRWVTCPVARHNTWNTDGISYAGVWVVGEGTYSGYFDNVKNDGTLGYWNHSSITIVDPPGYGYLSFNINSSYSSTPYAILLYLPAGGKVASYVVYEY